MPDNTDASRGAMTVAEAGRKGGEATRDALGHEHYVAIGRKGGGRLAELAAAGRRALEEAAEAPAEGAAEPDVTAAEEASPPTRDGEAAGGEG